MSQYFLPSFLLLLPFTNSDSSSNGSLTKNAVDPVRALVESWGGTASVTLTAGGIDTWIAQQQQRQLELQQQRQYQHQQQVINEIKKKEQQFAALSQRRKRTLLARQATL